MLVALLYSSRLLHGSNRGNEEYLLQSVVTEREFFLLLLAVTVGHSHAGDEQGIHADGNGCAAQDRC